MEAAPTTQASESQTQPPSGLPQQMRPMMPH